MSNCSGLFGHMLRQLRSMLRHNRSPNKVRMDPLGSIFLWASYRRNVYLGRKKTNPLYIIWYNNWIPYDIIFSRICLWWCTRIWDLSVFVWGGVAGIVCCQSSHQIFASASADVNTVALTYLFVVGQDTESSCLTCWYIIPCGWLSGVRQWSIIGRTGWTITLCFLMSHLAGFSLLAGLLSLDLFWNIYLFVSCECKLLDDVGRLKSQVRVFFPVLPKVSTQFKEMTITFCCAGSYVYIQCASFWELILLVRGSNIHQKSLLEIAHPFWGMICVCVL
jgi:hypothetical protein